MKKILTFGLLLLGLSAFAGEPFFSTAPCSLYYERYKAGTTTLTQTTLIEVTSVSAKAGGGREVKYGLDLKKANGKPIYGGRTHMTVEIDPNSDVWTDFGGAVKSVLLNYFPNAKITASGDRALMPADMKPGDTLPDAHCTVNVGALKVTVDVTERTVLRSERITVPAGTFDCLVTREHKVEDAPIHHNDTWSVTWYAPGIGYVRHDSYDKKMRLLSSEVLVTCTAK